MNVCFNFLAKKHQEDNGKSVFTALIISYPPHPPTPTPKLCPCDNFHFVVTFHYFFVFTE